MKKLSVWKNKSSQRVPRSISILLSAAAFMSLILFSACGPLADSTTQPLSSAGPAMIMAAGIYERGHNLSSMAVRGGASFTNQGKRHYFKFEAVVLKPGHLLFTAFDPAGRPAFRLVSDGQTLTGILYGHKQYAVGPATSENFGRFIPLGITPDQLIALMSGAQVRPAEAAAVSTETSTELSILPANRPANNQLLWRVRLAGPITQNPAQAIVDAADFGPPLSPTIAIKYRAIKEITREDQNGLLEPFPHSVEIMWVEKDEKMLRVTYDEVRLGLPLDQNLFNLVRPDGFELVQLY